MKIVKITLKGMGEFDEYLRQEIEMRIVNAVNSILDQYNVKKALQAESPGVLNEPIH